MVANQDYLIDLSPQLSPNMYVEQRGDRVLLLDPEQPTWIVTNKNSANLLGLFDGNKSVRKILSLVDNSGSSQYLSAYGVIVKALELGILWVDAPPPRPIRPKTLNSVHLTLTRKCNLSCIYCYAGSGKPNLPELSAYNWKTIISQIYSASGPINFVLTGGEPTLFVDFEQVAYHIRSLNCTLQLITNGCWRKDVDLKSVVELFTQVIVSIDGSSSKINDPHRGDGTFEKAFSTVRLLREHQANVQVAVVVTKMNANDLNRIRNLFEPMGVFVKFQPVYPLGRGSTRDDILINGDEYFAFLRDAEKGKALSLFDSPPQPGTKVVSCGVGGGTLSIDSDGSVYPCHLLHKQEYAFGRLLDSSFTDILDRVRASHWYNFNVDSIEECKDCIIRYVCAADCRARAVAETGDLYSPDPFCSYFKKATLDFMFSSGKWTSGINARIGETIS